MLNNINWTCKRQKTNKDLLLTFLHRFLTICLDLCYLKVCEHQNESSKHMVKNLWKNGKSLLGFYLLKVQLMLLSMLVPKFYFLEQFGVQNTIFNLKNMIIIYIRLGYNAHDLPICQILHFEFQSLYQYIF
jgi:hypothetical protein